MAVMPLTGGYSLGPTVGELRVETVVGSPQPRDKLHGSQSRVTVTVSELSISPCSVTTATPETGSTPENCPSTAEPVSPRSFSKSANQSPDPITFPLFSLLPAELRLKIWHLSFLPRTVVLHTRRTHYADDNHREQPKWQSHSLNAVALSVSIEARCAALEHYHVTLPLYAPSARHHPLEPDMNWERPGDLLPSRMLYLNLEHDTVALLGDLHYTRLAKLLDWLRKMDAPPLRKPAAKTKGLKRLSMSMAPWSHPVGAATLKAFARTIFADLDEFVLFLYAERMPPAGWKGGTCMLQEASVDTDYYRRFLLSRGKQFIDGDGWMKVGKKPMKVAEIQFVNGW